jgi:hypothetical protein
MFSYFMWPLTIHGLATECLRNFFILPRLVHQRWRATKGAGGIG